MQCLRDVQYSKIYLYKIYVGVVHMKFEMSDIKSIVLYNRETQREVPCDISEKLEFKFQTEVKIPVEVLKEIDIQRLNCQLMTAGVIGITLAFNVIVRANLNDFLEESFKF